MFFIFKVQEEENDFEPVFETQAPECEDQESQLLKQSKFI